MELSTVKLGRNPHDPAVIAKMPRLDGHALLATLPFPYPPRLDRSALPFEPAMDANDRLGDCTAVGYANAARGAAALHGFQIDITVDQVVAFYARSCGYVEGQPDTDRGGVLVDVLADQAHHGFDATNQMLVADFAAVEPQDLRAVRAVTANVGMLYCGVDLALADQAGADVWDIDTPADAGDPVPGSWGGHCLGLWDWDGLGSTDTVRLATWGTFRRATWRWVKSRLVEAHAVMWRDLGPAVPGVDYDRLKFDLAAFLGSQLA